MLIYLTALLAGATLAVPAPAAPDITAAPVVPRQWNGYQYGTVPPCTYTMEAATSTFHGTARKVSNCACIGGFTTQAASTMISIRPKVVCGTITADDPAPSEFFSQPQVSAPAAVQFGDVDPMEIVSSISANCANGCGGFTTTIQATARSSGADYLTAPTPITIEYIVTADEIPPDSFAIFIQGLETMMKNAMTSKTFDYSYPARHKERRDEEGVYHSPDVSPEVETQFPNLEIAPPTIIHSASTTQFMGPGNLHFSRYVQDKTGAYVVQSGSLEVAITSVIDPYAGNICADIAGPVVAGLQALAPEAAPILGIIGALICTFAGHG